jgi:hypothetical protein
MAQVQIKKRPNAKRSGAAYMRQRNIFHAESLTHKKDGADISGREQEDKNQNEIEAPVPFPVQHEKDDEYTHLAER